MSTYSTFTRYLYLVQIQKVGHPWNTKSGLAGGFSQIQPGILHFYIKDLFVHIFFSKSHLIWLNPTYLLNFVFVILPSVTELLSEAVLTFLLIFFILFSVLLFPFFLIIVPLYRYKIVINFPLLFDIALKSKKVKTIAAAIFGVISIERAKKEKYLILKWRK